MQAGEQACVFLKWDAWPVTSEDFDLGLYRDSDAALVDSSTNDQSDGPLPPTEGLCYTNSGPTQVFDIVIVRYSAVGSPRFDLYYTGESSLAYATAAGSVIEPASSPDALAVGADCWQTSTLEPYSSQGPTIDGRTAPELLAPDSVSTVTYGGATAGAGGCGTSGFTGTSAASPQVAGAAADLLEREPSLTPAGLEAALEARSLARSGATQSADDVGNGQLQLGLPGGTGTIAYTTNTGSISNLIDLADADGAATHTLLDFTASPQLVARRLEAGDQDEQRPRDGRRRMGRIRRSSSPRRARASQDPAWSPDGARSHMRPTSPPETASGPSRRPADPPTEPNSAPALVRRLTRVDAGRLEDRLP